MNLFFSFLLETLKSASKILHAKLCANRKIENDQTATAEKHRKKNEEMKAECMEVIVFPCFSAKLTYLKAK